MNCFMFQTGSGPLVVLTSYASATDPALLERLNARGIYKFIAHEIPLDMARQRYGTHFDVVCTDLHETDDFRVLDYDGQRAFRLFRFSELGQPTFYEAPSSPPPFAVPTFGADLA